LCGNTKIASCITKDFCTALGENKTIEHLDISMPVSTAPNLTSTLYKLIATAIAMNKYKNGVLTNLDLMYAIP